MKYNILIIFFLSNLYIFSQNNNANDKRLSLIIGTSQGISFLHKEALSNTNNKTFDSTMGYAYSYGGGVSIISKSKKAFSDIMLNYRSYSNGIKGIVDINTPSGYSTKTSFDRFNYLSLEYRYSRYVKTIKDLNTFFSVGIQASYLLNVRRKLNYENSSEVIKIEGKNISENDVLQTSPTFIFSYGTEFNSGILKAGKKSRLSIDFTFDTFRLGIQSSPSNQYYSIMINYRILF